MGIERIQRLYNNAVPLIGKMRPPSLVQFGANDASAVPYSPKLRFRHGTKRKPDACAVGDPRKELPGFVRHCGDFIMQTLPTIKLLPFWQLRDGNYTSNPIWGEYSIIRTTEQ